MPPIFHLPPAPVMAAAESPYAVYGWKLLSGSFSLGVFVFGHGIRKEPYKLKIHELQGIKFGRVEK